GRGREGIHRFHRSGEVAQLRDPASVQAAYHLPRRIPVAKRALASGGVNGKTITEQKDLVSVPPLPMKICVDPLAWMTAEQGRAIKQWVLEGGSLFAYHNSSHVSLTNKDYRDVEGAVYTGHPEIRPFKVKIVNPEHPITRGVRDFVVTDEQHFMT